MYYMSIIGTALLFDTSLYLCRIVYRYYDRKLECYKEFLSFLYDLKHKMTASATLLPRIIDEVDNLTYLRECRFFEYARVEGISSAFAKISGALNMEREDIAELGTFFSGLGSNMLRAEIDNVNRCILTLERSYSSLKEQTPKNKKVSSTVIVCCALLTIIMIM